MLDFRIIHACCFCAAACSRSSVVCGICDAITESFWGGGRARGAVRQRIKKYAHTHGGGTSAKSAHGRDFRRQHNTECQTQLKRHAANGLASAFVRSLALEVRSACMYVCEMHLRRRWYTIVIQARDAAAAVTHTQSFSHQQVCRGMQHMHAARLYVYMEYG